MKCFRCVMPCCGFFFQVTSKIKKKGKKATGKPKQANQGTPQLSALLVIKVVFSCHITPTRYLTPTREGRQKAATGDSRYTALFCSSCCGRTSLPLENAARKPQQVNQGTLHICVEDLVVESRPSWHLAAIQIGHMQAEPSKSSKSKPSRPCEVAFFLSCPHSTGRRQA